MDETDLMIIAAWEQDVAPVLTLAVADLADEDDDRDWRRRHDETLGDMP
jgi:putative ribosome biogenesis GTPase RsgA